MSKIIKKSIEILPDRSLMPKIGQSGYSVSQAISEFIDNAIDASEPGKLLNVDVVLDSKKDTIEIRDDGTGMDERTAANSIKLAHSKKDNKLGEFGLGLKTAANSLGKSFLIKTTQKKSDEEYILEYNEDQWLKSGDWTKYEMKIKKGINKLKSGTTVTISLLIIKIYPNLPVRVRNDLSTRFAPYIDNGEINIKVNNKFCQPVQLDLNTEYSSPDGKEAFEIKLESGQVVKGWRGLLRKGSDRGEYGFRIFRRGRLIEQFAKIGFSPHPEARQIVGELHVDHIPVTHNKREFISESALYQELVKEGGIFWNFMREIVKDARSSTRKSKIDKSITNKVEVQKENIMQAIKRLPELKEYAFPEMFLNKKKKSRKEDEEISPELEKKQMVDIKDEPEKGEDDKKRKKRSRRTYYITINGKKFKVDHDFVDLKTEEVLKDKVIENDKGINVFTNTSFPAFANTNDHVFYGAWNIAEALAEIMVDANNRPGSEVNIIRDKILKKSSEITRELDQIETEKKMAEKLKRDYEKSIEKIKKIQSKIND